MSKLTYLASNTKLPVGSFVSRPDVIYSSYTKYRESKDYVDPVHVNIQPPYKFAPEVYNTDCPVWVYRNEMPNYFHILDYELIRAITISDFDDDFDDKEISDGFIEQNLKDQEVSHHFTVPYIYYIGQICDEDSLRRFLCEHLELGNIAERYDCWSCEESQPRDKRFDLVIDLQSYINSKDVALNNTKHPKRTCKMFVTYHAPKNGSIKNDWVPNEDLITVYRYSKVELIPYYLGEKFGRRTIRSQ